MKIPAVQPTPVSKRAIWARLGSWAKKKGVGIYELLGTEGDIDASQKEYTILFESAVRYFQDRQFEKAIKNFERCLSLRSDDKAALLFITTARTFMTEGIPSGFDGTIELTEK